MRVPRGRSCETMQESCVEVTDKAIWYGNAANAMTTEALAVRDGVKLAYDMGLSHVILETDCSEVVKRWLDREKDRSKIVSIIQEVEELSGNFISFRINYIGVQ